MRKNVTTIAGVHAPGPKPTALAALLVAAALSLLLVAALGLWRLAMFIIG